MAMEQLRERYPWPAEPPAVEPDDRGWCAGQNRATLKAALGPDTKVVLELGSFLGLSTRFICEYAPNATIIAIDHWRGSVEHQPRPELAAVLPVLYETFLKNLWPWRDRVVPVRETTVVGMATVNQCGIIPDVVYIDAAHDADSVGADLRAVLEMWPDAHIIGDDWTWASVRCGVGRVLPDVPPARQFVTHHACWELKRG